MQCAATSQPKPGGAFVDNISREKKKKNLAIECLSQAPSGGLQGTLIWEKFVQFSVDRDDLFFHSIQIVPSFSNMNFVVLRSFLQISEVAFCRKGS